MKILKSKKWRIAFSIFSVLILVALFSSFVIFYITTVKKYETKTIKNEQGQLTYIQVMNSKQDSSQGLDYYKSSREGENIFWLGKVSNYYSQNSGIKFCLIDEGHKDIDINKPCAWFWASSNKYMNASSLKIDFSKYKKDCDMSYWVAGKIKGIDCSYDICVPDIEISNIIEAPGSFCEINE